MSCGCTAPCRLSLAAPGPVGLGGPARHEDGGAALSGRRRRTEPETDRGGAGGSGTLDEAGEGERGRGRRNR